MRVLTWIETDKKGKVLEQRTFRVSTGPECHLLEVCPQEHRDDVKIRFKSAPPTMTAEMIWETLVRATWMC